MPTYGNKHGTISNTTYNPHYTQKLPKIPTKTKKITRQSNTTTIPSKNKQP
jgi:hypothetical protein